ncbi:dCTP deaminase [Patescibacteria group bacterium]
MSILAHDEIIAAVKKGDIKIEPFDEANIGPGSIDLTLSNKFRVFSKANDVHDVTEETDYKKLTEIVTADSIVVSPGQTILGITEEKITLAPSLCGWLEGRSRFARLGLLVHVSASFMQPGISNRQVLEISNMGQAPLRLHAGIRICQFIFQKMQGSAKYSGQFVDQIEP